MKKRYNFIDLIRGIAIINMVLYHLLYDLDYIFGDDIYLFSTIYAHLWQNLIAMTFIITSGISYNFGSKNIKKFIILLICASIISIISYIFMYDEFIAFGIIHFFAFATLFLIIFESILNKINSYIGLVFSALLFISTKFITNGYLIIPSGKYYLPEKLYEYSFLFWAGFPKNNFVSSDYFPLIPWLFLFLMGFYLGRIVLSSNIKTKKKSINPINIIGRYSLLIYMIHQPIIFFILSYFYNRSIF